GSVTFAGCVISDSTSSTPSHALFYTKHDRIGRFRNERPDIFVAAARLVPRSRLNVQAVRPCPRHSSVTHTTSLRGESTRIILARLCQGF
ncbi:hypothetical protein, partial [Bradyrhizobium sp.]|uniref:hypothetical protein n=1 Tax=Bradyrhizobium sp. TaxID=376 RepID=UPI0025C6287D